MSSSYSQYTSKTRQQKADRLMRNHRVILLGPSKAVVIGDHDTYDLIRLGGRWKCSCPWGQRRNHWSDCSHILALRRSLLDPHNQAPVARLADLLTKAIDTLSEVESA